MRAVLLVFATSDKGGTGRSVTSSNVVYQRSLAGDNACYLDFDFGSPTAGAIFGLDEVARGTATGGLHSYLQGEVPEPAAVDVWAASERSDLRARPLGSGRLVLYPGDEGGGEFDVSHGAVRACVRLFLRLQEEFDVCLVDLSAGRSAAIEIVLAATADLELRRSGTILPRWLVFHRWTRQHIVAAHGLVYGDRGLLKAGVERGHQDDELRRSVRFVRTAMIGRHSQQIKSLREAQIAWLEDTDVELRDLARRHRLGTNVMLGETPLDPMLQWREQLITEGDVWKREVANSETFKAFRDLAARLEDSKWWEGL